MSYDHGRFVWFELLTKDLERARSFYLETLPWTVEDLTMQDGSSYAMIKCGDAGVGGFLTPQVEMPTHWVSYVSVSDVDETAAAVKAAGGVLHADAFDVSEVGRMQPVSDPQGGGFCLFKGAIEDPQPATGPGSLHWNELWTQDPIAAVTFYEKVLGYTHDEMQMPNGSYYVLMDGDTPRGGLMKPSSSDIPTMWLQYVEVEDCDAALDRANKNGASTVMPPQEAENVGRFGIFRDPFGGMIGVIQPAARD